MESWTRENGTDWPTLKGEIAWNPFTSRVNDSLYDRAKWREHPCSPGARGIENGGGPPGSRRGVLGEEGSLPQISQIIADLGDLPRRSLRVGG